MKFFGRNKGREHPAGNDEFSSASEYTELGQPEEEAHESEPVSPEQEALVVAVNAKLDEIWGVEPKVEKGGYYGMSHQEINDSISRHIMAELQAMFEKDGAAFIAFRRAGIRMTPSKINLFRADTDEQIPALSQLSSAYRVENSEDVWAREEEGERVGIQLFTYTEGKLTSEEYQSLAAFLGIEVPGD